jgi:hypothetical protein
MKVENPNSALWQSCWRHGVSRMLKSSFSYFSVFSLGLLLCRLLWNGFGELVSVMERDPSCSRDTLYEQCEAQFCKRIGAEISGQRMKVERRKIYEAS